MSSYSYIFLEMTTAPLDTIFMQLLLSGSGPGSRNFLIYQLLFFTSVITKKMVAVV